MRRTISALALPLASAVLALGTIGSLSAQDKRASPEDGHQILLTTCVACHGADLSGGRGPSLVDPGLFARLGSAGVHARIAQGVPGTEMAAFEKIYSGEQIDAMVAWLAANPSSGGTAPAVANAPPRPATPAAPNPDGQRFHSQTQDIRLVTVASGFVTPSALEFLPDGRMLVTERGGALRIVEQDGTVLPPVTGTPRVHVGQDAGVLDVAVGPDYARDGWIYLAYSDDNPADPEPPPPEPGTPSYRVQRKPSMTVIVRGRLDADGKWTDQQDVFRAPWSFYTPSGAHYGSRLLFDGKGHLFFSIGERGDMTNARRKDTPLGKIHRVNLDGTVPADNPFAGDADAIGSIWSLGHRNPEGLDFDPASGEMWESEHGPAGGDEINVIHKGADYGWGTVSKGMQPGIETVAADGLVEPAAWYFPTIAPSGITFYQGDRYKGWTGSLFVTGLRGQQLRRLEISGDKVTRQEVIFEQVGRVRDIATGPDGLLYAIVQEPTGPGTGIDLSDPSPGVVVRLEPIEWKQEAFKRPS